MRANKILFDKISAQYEILKMSAAYILAEQRLMANPSKGLDFNTDDYSITFDAVNPEEFYFTTNTTQGMKYDENSAEGLLKEARNVREKLDNAIHDNDFIKAKTFQNILDGLEIKYNKLKDK